MWISEDIWNRLQNDGKTNQVHENPDYSSINANYLYIKIRNRGCNASAGTEQLKLYWSKASTGLSWPTNWVDYKISCVTYGDIITTTPVTIPVIAAGSSDIIEIAWYPPNPANFSETETHACLLARIESSPYSPFGMTSIETNDLNSNVNNNNNIVWKNVIVVNNPGNGLMMVGNVFDFATRFNLLFKVPTGELNQPFTADGMAVIDLGKDVYDKWVKGGKKGVGVELGKFNHMSATGILHNHSLKQFPNSSSPYSIAITGTDATLNNLNFEPDEKHTINVQFKYNAQPDGISKKEFNYDIIEAVTSDGKTIGGVRFNIHRPDCIIPSAGVDRTIGRDCKTTLIASPLSDSATYTWFDNATGIFIGSGSSIEVSPTNTTTYELQMASSNGCVDYDLVTVNIDLNDNAIACSPNPRPPGCFREVEIVPNPVGGNELYVKFIAEDQTNINISLTNTLGRVLISDNLRVNPGPIEHKIPLNKVPIGVYRVIIKCKENVKEIMITRL